ncbi:hypothetical protein B0T40_15050 [Chromobacterium haemolyticum]|uniref:GTPase-associated system all-helical protein GASH n=1 Tax=Chromobacterium haemolyticum TaxID=394935 RepID=UPI0009DA1504|nr:GTPase-associated system all-helical protein GASH [Chromobacterium haemolyticum]OQS34639.1 hypothetical protein B0T40_15050 [Chromobacterium haemolyticum]
MADDAEVPPMHTDFARWYGAVELGDDQSQRLARWEGVCSIVSEADRDIVEALVRLAFGTRQVPAAADLQRIRQTFKSTDAAFDMQGNDREVQVLAGACLAVLFEKGGSAGAPAALAVTTGALGGARKADVPMDLGVLAESAIYRIADVNRSRPLLSNHMSVNVPKFDFEKAVTQVREQPNWDGVAQAFALAASSTQSAIKAMAQRQANAVRAMDKVVRIQDEELQMLWWLTGERSWDYDCTFETVPADAQPLIFAKELADSTEFLPGPPSVKALLSRAGLKERKKVTIPAAINAVKAVWLQQLLAEEDPSPVSTPLHFAIKRQLETGAGDAWVAGWAAATGVSSSHSISPLMLGTLFYRERLLLQFE